MKNNRDSLEAAKNWKQLEKAAEERGLEYLRTTGGHKILGNEKGSIPFSTHEKEIGKNLLCKVKKQIKLLTENYKVLAVILVCASLIKFL